MVFEPSVMNPWAGPMEQWQEMAGQPPVWAPISTSPTTADIAKAKFDAGQMEVRTGAFSLLPLVGLAAGWAANELIEGALGGGGGGGMAAIQPYTFPTVPTPGQAEVIPPGSNFLAPDVPLVGPGVKEPPNYLVKKRWETKVYDNELGYIKLNFYALTNGYIAMYHNTRKYWKMWKPKKHIVISSNPRLKDLKKLDRLYKRTQKMVAKYAPKKPRVTSTQAPSRFLSSAERQLLKAGS